MPNVIVGIVEFNGKFLVSGEMGAILLETECKLLLGELSWLKAFKME